MEFTLEIALRFEHNKREKIVYEITYIISE